MAINYVQGITNFLAGSGVTNTATSIQLTNFTYPDGSLVIMADFGTLGFGTLEPETEREENFSFTGITQNADGSATITGVTRGLQFKTPYAQDLALRKQHAGGTKMRITNSAPFYNLFANKNNNETITALWTFTSTNIATYNVHPTFTLDTQIIDKKYADDLAFAGSPDASPVVKGISQEATQVEEDARTIFGSTGARLYRNPGTARSTLAIDFQSSVTGTDDYAITPVPAVTALVDGMEFNFEADVANTGVATLNVAGLGAKTIKKYGDKDLVNSDIAAGSIVKVIYDLDSDTMMLQSAIAKQQITQDFREVSGSSVTGTDSYAITLSPAPTAYALNQKYTFLTDVGNTGAATLNVNGLGAVTIKKNVSSDLATGDLLAGQVVTVVHDGANFQLEIPTAVPAVRTVLVDSFTITLAGSVAEQTIATTTIPANILGSLNGIRVRMNVAHTANANGDNFTVRFKFGGATSDTITMAGSINTLMDLDGTWFMFNTAVAAQKFQEAFVQYNQTPAITARRLAGGTTVINTAVNQTFEVTVQTVNAVNAILVRAIIIELLFVA